MSGKKYWSTEVGAIAVWFSHISIFSSNIPLDFHDSIRVVPLKYSVYFFAGIDTT